MIVFPARGIQTRGERTRVHTAAPVLALAPLAGAHPGTWTSSPMPLEAPPSLGAEETETRRAQLHGCGTPRLGGAGPSPWATPDHLETPTVQ